jgi:hypothetical protein
MEAGASGGREPPRGRRRVALREKRVPIQGLRMSGAARLADSSHGGGTRRRKARFVAAPIPGAVASAGEGGPRWFRGVPAFADRRGPQREKRALSHAINRSEARILSAQPASRKKNSCRQVTSSSSISGRWSAGMLFCRLSG